MVQDGVAPEGQGTRRAGLDFKPLSERGRGVLRGQKGSTRWHHSQALLDILPEPQVIPSHDTEKSGILTFRPLSIGCDNGPLAASEEAKLFVHIGEENRK